MKRKGRKHLPKVGTRPDNERVFRQSQQDLINFGRHRKFRGGALVWVAVAIGALVLLISWIALT